MSKRNYGIDLLRIISMIMVVILHILGHGGVLSSLTQFSLSYYVLWFLEIACYCAVNCYGLISGYVGINTKRNFTNLIVLWFQVLFYTVLITLLFSIFKPEVVPLKNWITAFTPTLSKQYWFFSSYFCLYLLTPLLNKGLLALSKRENTILISSLILFTCLLTTLYPSKNDPFLLNAGYSTIWLVILYILGAYIKLYMPLKTKKNTYWIKVYLSCIIITLLFKNLIELSQIQILLSFDINNMFISYISPTILFSAISLLYLSIKFEPSSSFIKIIKHFSPISFGVYLIHSQALIWNYVFKNRFAFLANSNPMIILLSVIIISIIIFLVLSTIDLLRLKLFQKLDLKNRIANLEKKILPLE